MISLQWSPIGFGCSAVDSTEHLSSIQQALAGGINLLDTSTNYGDGASQLIVGRALAHTGCTDTVLVSKIGYVRPGEEEAAYEMVGGCHCLHPDFLAWQLDRSLQRLGVDALDVCLLHNPEEQLRALSRDEVFSRIRSAFERLESEVGAGRIREYGVSSNHFARPAADTSALPLERVLAMAREVAGSNHHCRVIQLPLNLFEADAAIRVLDDGRTVLEQASQAGLKVLTNRPLSGHSRSGRFVLKNEPEASLPPDPEKLLLHLKRLERELRRQTRGHRLRNFQHFWGWLRHLGHGFMLDEQISNFRRQLGQQLDELEYHQQWREDYIRVIEALLEVCLREGRYRRFSLARKVHRELQPFMPADLKQADLSTMALAVVASTPGVTTVLNGMRCSAYVAQALQAMRSSAVEHPLQVYRRFQ